MMNTVNSKLISTAVAAFIIGVGGGYALGACKGHEMNEPKMSGESMNHEVAMTMNASMDGMMQGLEGKTGDDFDKAFISGMIAHHEGAVKMAEAALTNAKHQEIKDLSQKIITAQNAEIAEMKAWQMNWYGQ